MTHDSAGGPLKIRRSGPGAPSIRVTGSPSCGHWPPAGPSHFDSRCTECTKKSVEYSYNCMECMAMQPNGDILVKVTIKEYDDRCG
jgi:hypothetical protein